MLIEQDSREIVLLITGKMMSFKTPNSLYNNELLKDHRKNGSIPSEIFHAEVEV